MELLNGSQLKLVAGFLSNLAVVWLTAGLVGTGNWLVRIELIINGFLAIILGLYLVKEVEV